MKDRYNANPIALSEGKIYIDGIEVLTGVKCEIKFTPDVWEGRVLGERSSSSRWTGYKITGTITQRTSTPWLKEKIKQYQKDGVTPEMTIMGVMYDKGSDYYRDYGLDPITVVGCVLTGDLPLLALDSGGGVREDAISFNAKDLI